MKGNSGNRVVMLSMRSIANVLIIVSLSFCVFVLWGKVSSLNEIVVDLDERVYKLTSQRGPLPPLPGMSEKSLNIAALPAPVKPQQQLVTQPPKLETMHEIGARTGTDKIREHGYDRFYPYFLEHLRHKEGLKMFEIGYNLGASYLMWLEYFPKGMVYFMDKDYGRKYPEARFTGDQGKVEDLKKFLEVKKVKGKLDFIIDDGSHHPEHQMISFMYLFLHGLKPGGIYIIEDTETSYWRSGDTYGMTTLYGHDSPKSAINRLAALVDVVNRRYAPEGKPFHSSFGEEIDKWVQSVFFGPNAVVIVKMTPEEQTKYSPETYLWKNKLKEPGEPGSASPSFFSKKKTPPAPNTKP